MTPLAPAPFAEPPILLSPKADVDSTGDVPSASTEPSALIIGTGDEVHRFRIAEAFQRRVSRAIADEIDAIRSGPLVLTASEKERRTSGLTKLLHEEGLYGDVLQGPLTVDVLHSRALTLMNARVRSLMQHGS